MSEQAVYSAAVRQIAGLVAERDAPLVQVAGLVEERDVLRATIIEADSAYNLDGHVSDFDETTGLVRMCHEGAAALREVERLRAEAVGLQRWKDIALADHAIIEELQTGTERLRDGLRNVSLIVATLALTATNSTRADMVRLENFIAGVLERGYTPPAISYEAALEVRAGTPLGIDPLNILEVLE